MTKFVVAGDLHLWPVMQERLRLRGDSFWAAEQVFQYAIDNKLPVVHTGDFFDLGERGGVATVLNWATKWIPRLPGFIYVVGNHDYPGITDGKRNEDWLSSVFDVNSNKSKIIDVSSGCCHNFGGRLVCGFRHQPNRDAALDELHKLEKLLDAPVVLCHQNLRQLLSLEGQWELDADTDFNGLPAGSVVVCGHVHKPFKQVLPNGTVVISPGSTVSTSFDECHDKSFPVITLEGGNVSVERIPLRSRHIVVADVDEGNLAEILQGLQYRGDEQGLPEEVRKPVLYARYPRDSSVLSRLAAECEVKDWHFLGVPTRTTAEGKTEAVREEDQNEESNEIVDAVSRHAEVGTILYETAVELQTTGQVSEAIDRAIKKIMESS